MARGISIHVGVNFTDVSHYGSANRLPYCVNDARAMEAIARYNDFESYLLIDQQATTYNLFILLEKAAVVLEEGDKLFISLSGHGCNIKDRNGDEREDGYDEAFLMYDRMFIDDQLYLLWAKFKPGVRILVVSDACHCGTITKDPECYPGAEKLTQQLDEDSMPARVYKKNQKLYDGIFKNIVPDLNTPVHCSVLLLASSQDNQTSGAGMDSASGFSTFTEVLLECYSAGQFQGNYRDFHQLLCLRMKEKGIAQRPNYFFTGAQHPRFEYQKPFTI